MKVGPSGSAPAPAPPAPAPNPAPVPAETTPAQAPARPATEQVGLSIRERLAKGENFSTIFAENTDEAPVVDPAAHDATATDGGEGEEGDQSPVAEGEGEQPPTDAEGAESEEELTVELPGRREGDEVYSITVDNPETADRLRQLANGYMRGEQVRQERAALETEVRTYREEREHFEDLVATDPVGLLSETLEPPMQAQVALSLLAMEGVLESLPADVSLEDLTDPDRLEQLRLRLENQRFRMQTALQQRNELRKKANENAAAIRSTLERMIEAGNLGDRGDTFISHAIADIRDYAEKTNTQYIDPNTLPIMLAQRLREYGLNPVEIASALMEAGEERPVANRGRASVSGTNGRPPKGAPASPQKTATQFVAQAQARKKVAATVPAGAPPSTTPLSPPAGQTIAERTEWLRKHRGFLTSKTQ